MVNRFPRYLLTALTVAVLWPASRADAAAINYWNVFNIEGETAVSADIVTYGSLADMATDSNRTGVYTVGGLFGRNVVGSGSDGSTYWNVFNIEGETAVSADIVTYASLADMLTDSNRTGVYTIGGLFGRNVVGGGSDGSTYWNVFNIEGETAVSADFVTYGSLADMAMDSNRTGVYTVGGLFGRNIVGSGSDGSSYWSVFNIEGESGVSADIVTYASLTDMLTDSNRTAVYTVGGLFGRNVVGGGAEILSSTPKPVPEPGSALLIALALSAGLCRRRSGRGSTA